MEPSRSISAIDQTAVLAIQPETKRKEKTTGAAQTVLQTETKSAHGNSASKKIEKIQVLQVPPDELYGDDDQDSCCCKCKISWKKVAAVALIILGVALVATGVGAILDIGIAIAAFTSFGLVHGTLPFVIAASSTALAGSLATYGGTALFTKRAAVNKEDLIADDAQEI